MVRFDPATRDMVAAIKSEWRRAYGDEATGLRHLYEVIGAFVPEALKQGEASAYLLALGGMIDLPEFLPVKDAPGRPLDAPFEPDWVSAPGETIDDILTERSWSRSHFAKELGEDLAFVDGLIKGVAIITPQVAIDLFRVLGSTPAFWMEREKRYRAGLVRLGLTAGEHRRTK